jgi:predicted  nucleic acid-binding Zn-ribbon protein
MRTEYKAGSTGILRDAPAAGQNSCRKETETNKDVLEDKSISEIAGESHEDILEIIEPRKKDQVEMYDRVETIRIVSPGNYELNLEKMAQSDQRIVSVGKEGNYVIDLMSMAKDLPKKKKGRK